MADCDRNREACVLDNTGGGVPPPEEPPPPPQASRASAPVAANPGLASAAPASVSAAAVSWAPLAACGSRAATIRSLMITWRLPVPTPLPCSANARYGSRLTRCSSRLAGPRRLEEASPVIGRARFEAHGHCDCCSGADASTWFIDLRESSSAHSRTRGWCVGHRASRSDPCNRRACRFPCPQAAAAVGNAPRSVPGRRPTSANDRSRPKAVIERRGDRHASVSATPC